MKKELIQENRSKILFALFTLAALLLAGILWRGVSDYRRSANDHRVEEQLLQLTYGEESALRELSALQPLQELQPLSASVKGQLYRAMTEISYMTGDEMLYNQYVARALFYLRSANDTDSVVYLTNKFIGRLYANGCYQTADGVLQELAETCDIGSLSPALQASFYLSRADVTQMLGENAGAYFSGARLALARMEPSGERALNQAKLDILYARDFIERGDFAQAELLMAAYDEHTDFGLGEDQVYVVCDFRIPYQEIMTKLALHRGDTDAAVDYLEAYVAACDDYQFRTMKLRLLEYAVARLPGTLVGQLDRYTGQLQAAYAENLKELTAQYGAFLLSNIHVVTQQLEEHAAAQKLIHRRVALWIGLAYGLVLLVCVGAILLDYISKDGLTRINSRRKYEKARTVCERRHIPYCLLLFDIDGFKKVNDTFGHEKGDQILRAFAAILRGYSGRGISVYRYGGEEICMMLLRVPEQRAREIAEEIRRAVETTVGTAEIPVTVSGGVGVSRDGENVFRVTDQRLYEAKSNGKNQIR